MMVNLDSGLRIFDENLQLLYEAWEERDWAAQGPPMLLHQQRSWRVFSGLIISSALSAFCLLVLLLKLDT